MREGEAGDVRREGGGGRREGVEGVNKWKEQHRTVLSHRPKTPAQLTVDGAADVPQFRKCEAPR